MNIPKPPAWTEDALCARVGNPDGGFPAARGRSVVLRDIADAKEACSRCPVRVQCLNYALTGEADSAASGRHGIWGGLTPDERAALRGAA